eukprot:jgi/Mesvir1/23537/Mv18237-RA.2
MPMIPFCRLAYQVGWSVGVSHGASPSHRSLCYFLLLPPRLAWRPQLTREFVRRSLYDKEHGYFAAKPHSIGRLDSPLPFHQMRGHDEYRDALGSLYRSLQHSWLTPVEIFQPWYAFALAKYILHKHAAIPGSPPLKVVEIGGGNGTCARDVLRYIAHNAPDVYRSMSYTCVEISAAVAQAQRNTVLGMSPGPNGKDGTGSQGTGRDGVGTRLPSLSTATRHTQEADAGNGHVSRFRVENRDATERNGWGPVDTSPCFIIMLEVADNLPHDRVWLCPDSGQLMQTYVETIDHGGVPSRPPSPSLSVREAHEPVHDPLILQCLQALARVDQTGALHRVQGDAMLASAGGAPDSGHVQEGADASVGGEPGEKWSARVRHLWGQLSARENMAHHVSRWLPRWLGGERRGHVAWLPTGCMELLNTLHAARPAHMLIAADFATLPDVTIEGDRAPLVASTVGGRTVDHTTYLVPEGSADIFFPTDFNLLREMDLLASATSYHKGDHPSHCEAQAEQGDALSVRQGWHVSTAAFMRTFADHQQTQTKSGYNPLLEDFSNTRIYLSSF